jgi:hypothetical protein
LDRELPRNEGEAGAAVPTGRVGRLPRFGGIAAGIADSVAAGGCARLRRAAARLRPVPGTRFCEAKGVARSFDVMAGGRTIARAAWAHGRPTAGFAAAGMSPSTPG